MLEKSKLLIVDDRPENLYALEEALSEADVEIVKANGGNEALKASLIHDFALMILDVNMPEMDGFELAGILRDREETKHVPLIFVTGVYKEYDSLFKGYKTGAVDYILKPVDTDMLLSKVRVFVELDRQKRELAESNRRLLLEIAERERAEAESRRAKDAAEAANRAKSDFLANMSHELRTPLHAILGYSQLHGDDPNLTPEQKGDLATIRRRGEHLLVLINQVLDLSNLEKGRVEAVEINFDLHEFLDEMEEVYQPHAREKGIAPRFQRAPNVPRYARADAVKLRQVLINLLNNAFKYTEVGEVTVKTDACPLNAVNSGESDAIPPSTILHLQFVVSDTGPGVAPGDLPHLFKAFAKSVTGREWRQGAGLGLAISKRFVQLMGGEIEVESEVGRGTTFTVVIPAAAADAADVETGLPAPRALASATGDDPGREVDKSVLTPQRFRALPGELREAFKSAVERTDPTASLEVIQRARPHDEPLADALTHLVGRYRFDIIQELFEKR